MGIETILIVIGVIAVTALVVATVKSKKKITHEAPPPAGTVRPPSETDRH